ncbi:MAG: FtsW/RodA/SpoVE family cell cycle protein [Actinomycetota bacterium]|nr:FtsW/RodA/SpoVE family cell cycle protein [Actinomycetota bacterium]
MPAQAIALRAKPRRRSELGLLLVGLVVVVLAFVLESFATLNKWPPNLLTFVVVSLGLVLFLNVVNRRLAPNADPVIVPVVLLLNGLGWVMLSRLAPYVGASHLAGFQALWTLLGAVAYVITLALFRRSRDLERYRYLTLFLSIGLLVLPLLPHIGETPSNANGARLWVKLGPVTFQPVEISKILLVVFFASYFVEKQELLSMSTNRIGNRLFPDLRSLGPVAFAWLCSVAVILLERDIGFSLLLFVMFLAMLWVTTGRWTYLVIGIIAFAVGTYLASQILHQLNQRIEIWIDPWKYLAPGTAQLGYQPVLGELSLAKGGLSGTGLGLGAPQNIPVAISDFIFAAFGEELGLIGATAVVAGFVLIVGSGLRVALRARSEFSKLCALGLTVILGFQAFFIMGGVARLLPLTGVTLPFVSYGGSSLIANYILVAVLMRISDEGSDEVRSYGEPVPIAAALARS